MLLLLYEDAYGIIVQVPVAHLSDRPSREVPVCRLILTHRGHFHRQPTMRSIPRASSTWDESWLTKYRTRDEKGQPVTAASHNAASTRPFEYVVVLKYEQPPVPSVIHFLSILFEEVEFTNYSAPKIIRKHEKSNLEVSATGLVH